MPRPNKWYTEQLKIERAASESDAHSPNEGLIPRLDLERQKFGENAQPLLPKQVDAFNKCRDLLQESATSLANKTRQSRSRRLQARTALTNIFSKIGPEVFLLCALAQSISKLGEKPPDNLDLVAQLQSWWASVSHPRGLTQAANEICETNSIGILVARYSQFRDDTEQGASHSDGVPPPSNSSPGPTQQNHETEEDVTHAESPSAQPFSQTQVTSEPIELQASQRKSAPQSPHTTELTTEVLNAPSAAFADATTSAPPASEAVVNLNLADILGFLQQYHQVCPNLQMTCPVSGVPLPSIDIQFSSNPELSMKITFSVRLCEWLIRHVMDGRDTVMG